MALNLSGHSEKEILDRLWAHPLSDVNDGEDKKYNCTYLDDLQK